ncbi:metaxin-2 isoform 3-T3 [Megaptera novaeangliae]
MSLVAEAFVSQIAAAEPWPENATLYQQLKGEQILLSDNAASLAVQAFLQMCNLPVKVVCRANAEYMSPSGKVPFIHVGNQVVSELGPIVQFVKAKLYLQWCDEATVGEITHARYGSPYPWPLNHILAYQKQWEVKRKMKAIGWGNKTLDQVLEDVDQCCQALSQRLGTQPYFFNKQYCGSLSSACHLLLTSFFPEFFPGASLVAQWLGVCLPMQGTRVRALVWEDPTCRGATRPVSHNC